MLRRTLIPALLLFSLLLSGCGALQPEPTATPTLTPIPPTATNTPTITPSPTVTPSPTPTFTPTPLSAADVLAKNNVDVVSVYNVEVELARVLVGSKDVLLQGHPQIEDELIFPDVFLAPSFADKPVVLELVLRITNSTDRVYSLFISEGIVQTGSSQVKLEEFLIDMAGFGALESSWLVDILPGSTVYGGIWVALDADDLSEVDQITILLEKPFYEQSDGSYMGVGRNYYYSLDLSEWGFEPIPADLRDNLD